jgi:hypothetical protein
MRKKIAKIIVGLYLLGAIAALAAFVSAPPDGLANLPIVIWTLPTALIGLAVVYWPLDIAFPFMPSAFGYYGGHIAYFLPSVALIALLLWRVIGGKRS